MWVRNPSSFTACLLLPPAPPPRPDQAVLSLRPLKHIPPNTSISQACLSDPDMQHACELTEKWASVVLFMLVLEMIPWKRREAEFVLPVCAHSRPQPFCPGLVE